MLSDRLRKAKIRQDVSRLNTDPRDLDFDEIADGFDLKDDPQIYNILKELSQREVLRAEVGDYHDIIPDPGRPGKWTFSEYKESDPVLTHNQQNASLNHYLNSELSGGYMPSLPMDTDPALMAELEEAVKALMSRETLEKFGGKHGMHGGTRRVSDQPGVMAQYIHDLGLGYDRVYRDPITHQKPNQGHIAAHASSDILSHLKENIRLQGGHLNQILQILVKQCHLMTKFAPTLKYHYRILKQAYLVTLAHLPILLPDNRIENIRNLKLTSLSPLIRECQRGKKY